MLLPVGAFAVMCGALVYLGFRERAKYYGKRQKEDPPSGRTIALAASSEGEQRLS